MTPEHIDQSIARALKGESYLDPEVLKIHGFATATMRHLFSNLCHLEGISYLEVGTFTGSTLISAFNNNPIHAVGIDNFSQDFGKGNIREQFTHNLDRWDNAEGQEVDFYEGDCFEIASNGMLAGEIFDVLYYDGFHGKSEQAKALPAFIHLMADRFIFIVDDTNWKAVSDGTAEGFAALAGRVNIERKWNLTGGTQRSDHKIWWNGIDIYLCSKIK